MVNRLDPPKDRLVIEIAIDTRQMTREQIREVVRTELEQILDYALKEGPNDIALRAKLFTDCPSPHAAEGTT